MRHYNNLQDMNRIARERQLRGMRMQNQQTIDRSRQRNAEFSAAQQQKMDRFRYQQEVAQEQFAEKRRWEAEQRAKRGGNNLAAAALLSMYQRRSDPPNEGGYIPMTGVKLRSEIRRNRRRHYLLLTLAAIVSWGFSGSSLPLLAIPMIVIMALLRRYQ